MIPESLRGKPGIWDGTNDDLANFIQYCNNNPYEILFIHVVDRSTLVFLDLELGHNTSGQITYKTHFKPTAGNSYVHAKSGHHKRWIRNIPEGQFGRLRRTCSELTDYITLGGVLKKKFVEKGYDEKNIEEIFQRHRIKKLPENKVVDNTYKISFCTQYNEEAGKIKKILDKHWSILMEDPVLREHLPTKPTIIYKKPRTIRNIVAPTRLKQNTTKTKECWLGDRKGNYRCGISKCGKCKYIDCKKKEVETEEERIPIKRFITCSTEFVIYAIVCPCKKIYVGRTSRKLRTRFGEHRRNMKNKNKSITNKIQEDNTQKTKKGREYEHTLSRHYRIHHGSTIGETKLFGLEAIAPMNDKGLRHKKRK